MGLLGKLIPTNLLSEKERFLANPSYNPQFVYADDFSNQDLTTYGLPTPELVQLAEKIVKQAYFGRNEQDLWMMEGSELTQAQVDAKVHSYLSMHQIADRFSVVWSSTFITRAAITTDTVKLRLPCFFRKEGLLSMMYHEIGTHALRRINYEQQPWYKQKKKFGFSEYLPTEEGLAALHSLLPREFNSAFNSALRYLAVAWAQQGSFAEVWRELAPFVQDPERRWDIVFRQKRGMTDTSQPGGFTKDLCYFQGMIQVWRWLADRQFDPTSLYIGKCALADVDKAVSYNPDFLPLLPSFYTLDPKKYQRLLQKIGVANYFA